VMKVYERVTGIMKDYAEDAMKKLEETKPSDDHEAGVLEKLMKIDKHVAFVMVLDSLIAGVDTTTTGVVSVLYGLAKNPEKQEILRKEVLSVLPDKSLNLTTQSLNNRSLRMNPPINGNLRAAGENLVIQGYQIPSDVSF
jgi:cytochrome P450 family 12